MSRVKGWFSFVIERNVKELDLHLKYYSLPQSVLNAVSLTVLKLNGMVLKTTSLSTLHSLKVLFLIGVEFDANSLQNLISGCPIIEDLHLKGRYRDIHVDFSIGKTLKYLSLSGVTITCQWLEGLIYGLPLLERLTLYSCDGLKNISINSHSLKSLYYEGHSENISIVSHSLTNLHVDTWFDAFKATFRSPNLVYLSLFCRVESVISIEAPKLLEGNLKLSYDSKCVTSYDNAVHLLANFKSLKKMKLCMRGQDIIFSRNTWTPPLPNLKHLKLKIPYHLKRKSELEDFVSWCAPSLETLEIDDKK
ncbi:hypothetical protein FNV43_RR01691 [Rhamnella rubrinervis]|uniref:F-box/LRR-repeat protein 15/At3g58940/PEG3-like LRR domain-containing protein n=1 Tax=Rhamnella rubrinervis TaxID=2594499 RepID=A0A8K0HSW9_9ROSA|nr:hypothetical protein FNV43_RR01691 [Rhamnella rubrinervis]